jgi:hypothetical protein
MEKKKMLDVTKTLEEVLATEAQAIWIMLLFALKANQRYWYLFT